MKWRYGLCAGWRLGLLLACLLLVQPTSAAFVDFETDLFGTPLVNGTPITTQFLPLGVTFQNATILTAGITLNEFEFPPHSGANVVFDDDGGMTLLFTTPIMSVGGFFTYGAPLTLQAFLLGSPVAAVNSAFANNMALSGDLGSTPNEFLAVSFLAGIDELRITGLAGGGSFVLDDLVFPIPLSEPPMLALVAAGLLLVRRPAPTRSRLPG